MKLHVIALTLSILTCLTGCVETPVDPNATPTPIPEEPRPFKETNLRPNLVKLEFANPLKGDEINPNGQNYAKAIRRWLEENPDRKIVTMLGLPHFGTATGLQAVWLTTGNSNGEKQQVIQLDLPTELPEQYTIATLIFSASTPCGIVGITP